MKNGKINYMDQGPREAMPIVLIHAFPLNHTMWNQQILVLAEKYRVITYDIRGFGESDVDDGQYTIELFVDDLIDLLDCLKIQKTVLCGLSMGGYIALRALERYPERFSGFILSDTRSETDTDEVKIKRSAALRLLKEKGVPFFAEGFVESVFTEKTVKTNPEIVRMAQEMILKNSPLGIGGALLAMASRTDTTALLEQIEIPTLIMVGEKDQITPPAAALAMKEKIKNAQMYIVPHAGHLSNLENPVDYNKSLMSFLSDKKN